MLGLGLGIGIVVGVLVGMWLGKQLPNGEPIALSQHPRVKEGHYYWVESLVPSRLQPGLSPQYVAVLRDQQGLYNPFLAFVVPGDNCKAGAKQLAQAIYQEDGDNVQLVLFPVVKNVPMAC